MKDILIIINNRDRVSALRELVSWLTEAGYCNLIILDNDSTYAPLLEYYETIKNKFRVEFLSANLGSKALWHRRVRHLAQPPFIYTDSDIVPVEGCPSDAPNFFLRIAELYPGRKIGFGLKIDDIPEHYSPCKMVKKWEERHWKNHISELESVPLYDAPIDTTFALYTEFSPFSSFSYDAIRTGAPYSARHLPWYINSASPSKEDTYYESRVSVTTHSWGIDKCFSKVVQSACMR